jgi:hypothetical protein
MKNDITAPKPHRLYYSNVVMVKNSFEPYEGPYDGLPFGTALFRMVEYAYMGCNCGEVMKSRVKTKIEAIDE